MHDIILGLIGSQTCSLAGTPCVDAEAVNMGIVVLGLLALGISVAIVALRRQWRRDGYYV